MSRSLPRHLWQFSDLMMKADAIGLYVHIPFCLRKCNYCDFCSFSDLSRDTRRRYIDKLKCEILGYKKEKRIKLDTVFFGGGTPSLLSPSEFSEICDAILEAFEISPSPEFTVEVNPKTVTPEKLSVFKSRGMNRVSIGLQSIHENELKKLGRVHTFEDFLEAYKMVKAAGIKNISFDIMYGIPEQTKESFRKTLEKVVSLDPSHISVYGLILEENTPFWDVRDKLPLPDEDTECDMYYLASEILCKNGYSHYEISNYSKAGLESKHNLKYWRNMEYIGVGVAAYSYYGGKRYGNTRELSEYISSECKQYKDEEILSSADVAYEYAMLGLRLSEGISLSEYKRLSGNEFAKGKEDTLSHLLKAGYIIKEGDRIALTEKGFYISNTILTELL